MIDREWENTIKHHRDHTSEHQMLWIAALIWIEGNIWAMENYHG